MSYWPTKVNVFWRNTTGDVREWTDGQRTNLLRLSIHVHLVAYSSKNLVPYYGNSATKLQNHYIMIYSIIFSRVDRDSETGYRSWLDGNEFKSADKAFEYAVHMSDRWRREQGEMIFFNVLAHIVEWRDKQ